MAYYRDKGILHGSNKSLCNLLSRLFEACVYGCDHHIKLFEQLIVKV